ncbi:putative metal chaperone, involved in Zn homeostasis, GTPase of COG0523 family [Lachnospiraceae bacterium TWA4]|nr:putative metal chaperone, involved in Zn homeostasis, GTPase of COG0523 family [Lachnospiraceae bacterium TWA4]
MNEIPVYLINGFLESGKTEFIQFTLAQPYFRIEGKTLLLLCEEGMTEYDEQLLEDTNTAVEIIDEIEELNPENLIKLEEKHHPERIIVEFNGMWMFKEVTLPAHWTIEQQITHVDASKFDVFYRNMKSLFGEMVKGSDLVIYNRCDMIEDLQPLKRVVMAVNPNAEVVFEDASGEVEEYSEEDLPYDVNADFIRLDDSTYGIWYLDALDHPERYDGKVIRYTGMVAIPKNFPKGYFVPGRMAMTCCEDDMAFLGFACKSTQASKLKNKDWVDVTAKISVEEFSEYGGEGPVLYASEVKLTKQPEQPIVSFM